MKDAQKTDHQNVKKKDKLYIKLREISKKLVKLIIKTKIVIKSQDVL